MASGVFCGPNVNKLVLALRKNEFQFLHLAFSQNIRSEYFLIVGVWLCRVCQVQANS